MNRIPYSGNEAISAHMFENPFRKHPLTDLKPDRFFSGSQLGSDLLSGHLAAVIHDYIQQYGITLELKLFIGTYSEYIPNNNPLVSKQLFQEASSVYAKKRKELRNICKDIVFASSKAEEWLLAQKLYTEIASIKKILEIRHLGLDHYDTQKVTNLFRKVHYKKMMKLL